MVVNRYSRPAQIAKFDPMSAEDIMAAPMLKQSIEDKQIADKNVLLKSLYNQQSLTADNAMVNNKRDELVSSLNTIAGEISSKGISRQRTAAFKKLKLQYDKEMSLSGTLGHSNAFVAKQELAKKNFYQAGYAAKWPKDKLDAEWKNHTDEVSAFNSDGSFVNDYKEPGLPNNVSIGDMFNKIKIGTSPIINKDGTTEISNYKQLLSAGAGILKKFTTPGTEENRIMEVNQWSIQDIQELLSREIDSRTIGKPRGGAKVKSEAIKSARLKFINSKPVFAIGDHTMSALDAGTATERRKAVSDIKFNLDKANAIGDVEAANALEDEYNIQIRLNRKLQDVFERTTVGKNRRKALDDIETKLDKTDFFKFANKGYRILEKDGKVIVGTRANYGGGNPNAFFAAPVAASSSYTGKEEYRTKTLEGKTFSVSKKDYDTWKKQKDLYDRSMDALIDKGKVHYTQAEFNLIEPVDKTKIAALKAYKSNIANLLAAGGDSITIESATVLVDGKETSISSTNLKDQIKRYADKMKVIGMRKAGGLKNPGFRIQIPMPTNKINGTGTFTGDVAGKMVEIFVALNPKPGSLAERLLTTGLKELGTGDATSIAMGMQAWIQHKDFVAAYQKNDNYYNDSELKTKWNRTNGAASILGTSSSNKFDLYKEKGGKFRMRLSENGKFGNDVTYKSIFDKIKNVGDKVNFLNTHPTLNIIFNKRVNEIIYKLGKDPKSISKEEWQAYAEVLANSSEVIESDSEYTLINAFK